jgi:hypothetical protein
MLHPFLRLRAVAFLSLSHTCSSSKASLLLPIAAVTPLPKPSSLPSNECDCQGECTHYVGHSDRLLPLLSPDQTLPHPLRPSHSDPAGGKSLHQTMDSFIGFPKLPNTMPWTVGKERSLFSTGPTLPPSTPPKSLLVSLAFSWYSLLSWPALLSTMVGLYRVLLQLIAFNSCKTCLGQPSQGRVIRKSGTMDCLCLFLSIFCAVDLFMSAWLRASHPIYICMASGFTSYLYLHGFTSYLYLYGFTSYLYLHGFISYLYLHGFILFISAWLHILFISAWLHILFISVWLHILFISAWLHPI